MKVCMLMTHLLVHAHMFQVALFLISMVPLLLPLLVATEVCVCERERMLFMCYKSCDVGCSLKYDFSFYRTSQNIYPACPGSYHGSSVLTSL